MGVSLTRAAPYLSCKPFVICTSRSERTRYGNSMRMSPKVANCVDEWTTGACLQGTATFMFIHRTQEREISMVLTLYAPWYSPTCTESHPRSGVCSVCYNKDGVCSVCVAILPADQVHNNTAATPT